MKTVYVGMSGGVDSSLAAALLLERGYRVVGVYMKNWSRDLPGHKCPWQGDLQDAKKVSTDLGIDFKVYDFEVEYKQKVVDYMLAEYKAGRTPNPDIMCNQEVKFKLFLQAALGEGADLIATGHYAVTNKGRLFVARNRDKDQTYFLYRTTQEALSRTLFPIGEFETKEHVRREAAIRGIVTAAKKDSQGICFVGKVGIKDFLSQYIQTDPGNIIDESGRIIGSHDGAVYYTIGQRHGLQIGGGLPYYVVGKDMKKNEVYVTTNIDDKRLWHKEVVLGEFHTIDPKKQMVLGAGYSVRMRYRAEPIECRLFNVGGNHVLELGSQARAVTPGQSAVIYDQDECVGGGIVVRGL